jgi:large subunit ribosomal protein L15
MIHEITKDAGKHRSRKRIGRGQGSGTGKTSGRGHKGAGSRSGYSRRPEFEGGQMSLLRRLPKRGFTNVTFKTNYHVINVKVLEERMDDGGDVTAQVLADAGIIRDAKLPLKILGEGGLSKKLKVTAAKFSASARKKIEDAGGAVTVDAPVKWTRAAHEAETGKSKGKPKAAKTPKEEAAETKPEKTKAEGSEKGD